MNFVDYILRRILGRVINRGVDAGIRQISGERGAIKGEGKRVKDETRQTAQRAKSQAKLMNRLR